MNLSAKERILQLIAINIPMSSSLGEVLMKVIDTSLIVQVKERVGIVMELRCASYFKDS